MTSYGNIFFTAVARIAGNGIIVCSHSYNTETDLDAVKQVLEQPNMQMFPGKHYSFSVGQLAWHIIADEMGLIYILICQSNYPQRCAHMCLEELQRTVSKLTNKWYDHHKMKSEDAKKIFVYGDTKILIWVISSLTTTKFIP